MSPELKEKREKLTLPPSSDLAWMIVAIGVGGYTDYAKGGGRIAIITEHDSLKDKFVDVGRSLFQLEPGFDRVGIGKRGGLNEVVRFISKDLVQQIGDLSRDGWVYTLNEKYPWIYKPSYSLSALNAAHDFVGMPYAKTTQSIRFMDYRPGTIEAFRKLLLSCGIRRPCVYPNKKSPSGLGGLSVANWREVRKLANMLDTQVEWKEERLRLLRTLEKRRYANTPQSDEELLLEFVRITRMLGHVPSSEEIRELRNARLTLFTSSVYDKRFGNGRNYPITRENIVRILKENCMLEGII